jgi:hypothetical protein
MNGVLTAVSSSCARTFLGLVALALLFGCVTPDSLMPPPPVESMSAATRHGQELVEGLGACGFCHSLDGRTVSALSGGRLIRDKFGDVRAPNITLARSGIGSWSEADFRKSLRANIRPDESVISPDFHKGFEWIADDDVAAITYYIRSLPKIENSVEPRRLSFIDRNITGFFDTRLEVKGFIPGINPSFKTEYGQYLTDTIARCGSCHSKPETFLSSEEYLAGGQVISFAGESRVAPNITTSQSAGVGKWSEADLKKYLRSGQTPQGREADPRFCPVRFYQRAPEAHIDAVVAYLRSVPAIN